jgi:hypothetical protein
MFSIDRNISKVIPKCTSPSDKYVFLLIHFARISMHHIIEKIGCYENIPFSKNLADTKAYLLN